MKKIVIIDYGLGNLFSIEQAFRSLGQNTTLSSNLDEIQNADAIILPGVGAFNEAMQNLERLNLVNAIKNFSLQGKPILGVCLGMQLLFSESFEFGQNKGLDIVKGKVIKFPDVDSNGNSVVIPHVGWNNVSTKNTDFESFNNTDMYFVHSYYVVPDEQETILFETNYAGLTFCSAVKMENIIATQFHPEKSAKIGLELFRKWIDLI